jgi:hypothetical protein
MKECLPGENFFVQKGFPPEPPFKKLPLLTTQTYSLTRLSDRTSI